MMFHFQCFANFLQLPIELVVIKCIKALCIAWFIGQGSGGEGCKPDGMVSTLLTRQNIHQFHPFCDVFSSYLKSSALKI